MSPRLAHQRELSPFIPPHYLIKGHILQGKNVIFGDKNTTSLIARSQLQLGKFSTKVAI